MDRFGFFITDTGGGGNQGGSDLSNEDVENMILSHTIGKLSRNGTDTMTASLNMNNNKLINLLSPTNANDAVNLTTLQNHQFVPTASLNMNNNKIINLSNGTNANDGVNKSQLDLKANLASPVFSGLVEIPNQHSTYLSFDPTLTLSFQGTPSTLNGFFGTIGTIAEFHEFGLDILGRLSTQAILGSSEIRFHIDTNNTNKLIINATTTTSNNDLQMSSKKIKGLANATNNDEAVNKGQMDTAIAGIGGTPDMKHITVSRTAYQVIGSIVQFTDIIFQNIVVNRGFTFTSGSVSVPDDGLYSINCSLSFNVRTPPFDSDILTANTYSQIGSNCISGAPNTDNFGETIVFANDGLSFAVSAKNGGASNEGVVRPFIWLTNAWNPMTPIFGNANENIGPALAYSRNGNILMIGVPLFSYGGETGAGEVRVYERISPVHNYTLKNTIRPSEAGTNFNFGNTVACNYDGTKCIVGCNFYQPNLTGKIYIFEWSGSVWNEVFSAIGSGTAHHLGHAVCMNYTGDHACASSGFNGGYVKHYRKTTSWNLAGTLNAENTTAYFGFSMKFNSGETTTRLVIGDIGYEQYALTDYGAVWVYDFNATSGTFDSLYQRMLLYDVSGTGNPGAGSELGYSYDQFGYALDVNDLGNRLVISANMLNTDNRGTVGLFQDHLGVSGRKFFRIPLLNMGTGAALYGSANDRAGRAVGINGLGDTIIYSDNPVSNPNVVRAYRFNNAQTGNQIEAYISKNTDTTKYAYTAIPPTLSNVAVSMTTTLNLNANDLIAVKVKQYSLVDQEVGGVQPTFLQLTRLSSKI